MKFISRTSLLFLLLFGLVKIAFSQTTSFTSDQKELIKEALRTAVVTEKNLPEYANLTSKKKIVLLNKMVSLEMPDQPAIFITPEVVPEFSKVKFRLQTEAGIADTKHKKDFIYLRLAQIIQPQSEYAVVSVLPQWALGEKSRERGYTFKEAQAYSMLFQKINGKWQFNKIINSFPNLIDLKI